MLKIAFPVLQQEMWDQQLSARKLLAKTNLKYSTMIVKFRTGENVSVDEAIEIQDALHTDKTIRELFSKRKALA